MFPKVDDKKKALKQFRCEDPNTFESNAFAWWKPRDAITIFSVISQIKFNYYNEINKENLKA